MTNLQPCKFCKKDIDAKAKRCPECSGDLRNWFSRHKILTGIFLIIILIAWGSILQDEKDEELKTQAIEISPSELFEAYKNEANGNQKFKDKFVSLSGTVQSIDANLSDTSAIVKIDTPDEFDFSPIWCKIKSEDTQSNTLSASLQKGDIIQATGKVSGIIMKSIQLEKCEIKK